MFATSSTYGSVNKSLHFDGSRKKGGSQLEVD
jgi:hypothetical protein